MARPISIPIVSDVTGFLKGTRDVTGALDDVADSLDDVSREAQDAGRDAGRALSDGIEDGARDAERALDDVGKSDGLDRVGEQADQAAREVETATEKMERSFKDAFDSAKKESRDAGRQVGDNTKRGFDDAKDGAGEFRDEANSTARESAASFDGSAQSIGDAFQEVAANAFAGFGPAGAAAGLAAAAGLGFVFSALEKAKERAQDLRDRIGEIRDGFVAVRVDGESALSQVADRMREIVAETDPDKLNLDQLVKDGKELTDLEWDDYLRGVAGDPAARQRAIDLAREELAVAKDRLDGSFDFQSQERALVQEEADRAQARLDRLEAEQTAEEKAHGKRLDQAAEAIAADEARAKAEEEAAERAEERDKSYADARQNRREIEAAARTEAILASIEEEEEAAAARAAAISETTEAWQEHFSKITDDGKISMDELTASLDQMLADQARKAELYAFAQSTLTAEQMAVLEQFGEDRWAVLDTLMNTPPEARAATLAKLQAAGVAMGASQMAGFESQIPDELEGPRVRVSVNDSAWVRWANEVSRRGITVPLRVQVFANQAV